MTISPEPLDLEPIRNRFTIVSRLLEPAEHESLWAAANAQSAADVPSLIAEVERLRTLLAANHVAYLRVQGIEQFEVDAACAGLGGDHA